MDIVSLEDIGVNLYCPLTGKALLGDCDLMEVATVVGAWISEAADEPYILRNQDLEQAWEYYLESGSELTEEENEDASFPDIDSFLSSVKETNLFAIKYSQRDFACGPLWEVGWIVFDATKAIESEDYDSPA